MSEMLGNRYFLARQFTKAIPCLEEALAQNPAGYKIKKKLVICYIQVGKVEQAFALFFDLVQTDPSIITETDAYYDDCPCCELIPAWKNKTIRGPKTAVLLKILGMLYLYCDLETSKKYFEEASQLVENPAKILSVLARLSKI